MFLIQAFGLAPYLDVKYLRLLPSVSYLPSGLLLTGTGLFSMLVGYTLVSRSYKPNSTQSTNKFYAAPSLSLTISFYVGLLFLRLVLIALGGGEMIQSNTVRIGGDWNQWLIYAIELRWFFIALVTLQVAAGKWPRRLIVLLLLVEGGLAIISGWSSLLPKIILLVFSCLIYTGRKLPWRTLIPAAIIVTSLIVFSIPITRNIRFTGQISWSNLNKSLEATWGQGVNNGWKLFSDLIIGRQTVIAQTPSIVLNLIPDTIPYLPLQEVLVAPISFIPRVIWPSKPVYTNLGTWLTIRVFGGQAADGSSAVTMAGNAYMYGGWPVVIVGMAFMGILAALMYRWLAIPGLLNNQVGLLAVYAAVVIANFHLGESDFVSIWQGLIQRLFVFLVIARILCAKTTLNPPRKT